MKYKKMLLIQAKKYSDRLLSQICKVWPTEVSSVKEVMMIYNLQGNLQGNQYCQMPNFR